MSTEMKLVDILIQSLERSNLDVATSQIRVGSQVWSQLLAMYRDDVSGNGYPADTFFGVKIIQDIAMPANSWKIVK